MLSNRPYLIRAFHQWIVDSVCTPILVVNANHPRCKIPRNYADGGEIVFNISSNAIRDLKMTNEAVEFKASFSGVIHIIYAPIQAILAVYAEENGEGIFFDGEDDNNNDGIVPLQSIDGFGMREAAEPENGDAVPPKSKSKPFLTLVE